jgi:hypothetical protein
MKTTRTLSQNNSFTSLMFIVVKQFGVGLRFFGGLQPWPDFSGRRIFADSHVLRKFHPDNGR